MNKAEAEKIIKEKVIPRLEDFKNSVTATAFFLYIEYEGGDAGVATTISPAPDTEMLEDVMRRLAQEVYKETKKLPHIIIGCERIRYFETTPEELPVSLDIDMMDRGVIMLALEAATADGYSFLFTLPDMELRTSKEYHQSTNEDAPPYTVMAIASFMHETLVQAELIPAEEKEEDKKDGDSEHNDEIQRRGHHERHKKNAPVVKFKFSRN